ncbi:TetR/AcrR family transcriptional regulator [Herbiconiux liukaitaii]|uniref:TetR/AcrR family transcriptional regulator n=1 Tax=Herbiconiux liukaitaii TaxID=3342799 RepID=UPI0035BAC4DA
MPQSPALPAPTRRQGASVNLTEPRAARTHESLTIALFDLLRQHDLTEISISELCRTAGVHRTTFYGHYADIYAFASDSFARILDELADVADLEGGVPLGDPDPTVTTAKTDAELGDPESGPSRALTAAYMRSMSGILEHILDHRSAYRMMFGTRVDAGFRRDLHQRLLRHATLAVQHWRLVGLAPGIDEATAAAFIAGGSVGVFEKWALSDDTDVAARTADIMGTADAWIASRTLAQQSA